MPVGIIGLDLGVTTGMAWGIWNPALRDEVGLWTALARGRRMGHRQVYSEDIRGAGDKVGQIVFSIISDWNLAGMPLPNIRVCIEDFQAKPNKVMGGKAADKLAPVFLNGMIQDRLVLYKLEYMIQVYDPSISKAKANDDRLKDWARQCRPQGKMGWIKGKQHARDACRLIAVGLDREV